MADAEQPTASQSQSAEDAPESPLQWLKKKLGVGEASPTGNKSEDQQLEDENHSSTVPSNAGRAAQSTDASNQY